ncbi:MAG: ATP-binding protein [Thermodesulfobacteriota bacterium]
MNDAGLLYRFAPVGLLAFDRRERLLAFNQAAGELLHLKAGHDEGIPLIPFVHPDSRDDFSRYRQAVFSSHARQRCELDLHPRDGAVFPARMTGIALQPRKAGERICVAAVEDITGHRKAEATRRKSQAALERKTARAVHACRQEKARRRSLSKKLISLLEQERQQLARDLHDDIGQSLAGIKFVAEDLLDRGAVRDEIARELSGIRERVVQLMSRIRNFSHWLRPKTLDTVGLKPSLDQLSSDVGNRCRNLKVHFHCGDFQEELATEKKIACFRIAQEALTNVMKHARAEEVHLNLTRKRKALFLSIEDDGIGFEPDRSAADPLQKDHLGLLIMEERAAQFNGELVVDSQPGKGTHILFKLPL